MASTSSVFPGPVPLYCPCSTTTIQESLISSSSGSYTRGRFRSGAVNIGRQPKAFRLGTSFVDSFGRKRLTRNAGLEILSLKRLHEKRAGVARAGLPVVSSIPVLGPVMNALLNPVVLMIIYIAGASRFWSGFNRTTYTNSTSTKVALTALWPALYVASKAYRANFKKAVL
ncbi:hypothetical protein R1flu_017489 [Riccia fluitans]|uniref:Uncharacterized protein n=1 Tax=Riccia fluitans TaxID=41844 RepID=A0ABD1ZEE3_9MARC